MKRKNKKDPGFDEIIFENRNKEYGAYDLRKRYLPTTCFSIVGGAVFFIALVIILSLTIEKEGSAGPTKKVVVVIEPQRYIDPNKIVQPEPKKPEMITTPRNIKPEIVDDTSTLINNIPTADDLNRTVKNGDVTNKDTTVTVSDPVIPVEPEPVYFVKEMPLFPGGNVALMKFIYENIKYPEEAIDNNVEGMVVLKFVVSSDGSVKRPEIIKSVHPVLDQEAIRVVALLPNWKPGKQNGKAVPVWFSVPVTFKLKRN